MPRRKSGTGRKPRLVPTRYPSGHPVREAREEIAPTLIKRLKDELIPRARDKRLGSVLGLMHLRGELTEAEAEAGLRYAADVGAYERIVPGCPLRHARSAAWEGGHKGAGGLDIDELRKVDPEVAASLEKRIGDRRRAIKRAYDRAQDCIPTFPILLSTILEEVCCNDRPVHFVHHDSLRAMLRRLAQDCYPEIQAARAAERKRPAKADDLGRAAVAAMAAFFARRRAAVTSFLLSPLKPGVAPAITAYGHTDRGEPVEHTIRLKRSWLMAEAIHAQLLKAATAQGWTESTGESDG